MFASDIEPKTVFTKTFITMKEDQILELCQRHIAGKIDLLTWAVHFTTTLIAVIILFNIWNNYYQKKVKGFHNTSKDYGLLLLCGGLMIWALVSFLNFKYHPEAAFIPMALVLSVVNNGFFLASFAYFRHGFEWFNHERNRMIWVLIIGLVTVSFIVGIGVLKAADAKEGMEISEFAYSSMTLLFLGGLLFKSFESRRLYAVAFISIGVIFFAVFAQMLQLSNLNSICKVPPEVRSVVFLVSHSLMVAIFISLAFSWVIENEEIVTEIKDEEIAESFLAGFKESEPKAIEKELAEMVNKGKQLQTVIIITKEYFKRKGQAKDKKLENELILLSNRLVVLNISNREGLIRKDDYDVERNRITNSLLKIINEISERIDTNPDNNSKR